MGSIPGWGTKVSHATWQVFSANKEKRKRTCILLSEKSQSEKATYFMSPNYMIFQKIMETIKRSVVARVQSKGGTNRGSPEDF